MDIESRTRVLIHQLKKVQEAAGLTSEQLRNFENILTTLGGTSGTWIPNIKDTVIAINQMTSALSLLGGTDEYLSNVRRELIELAGASTRIGDLSKLFRISDPNQRIEAGINLRQRIADRQKYLQQASEAFVPSDLAVMGYQEIADKIGGKATALQAQDQLRKRVMEEIVAKQIEAIDLERDALQLADETVKVILAQAVQERQVTIELERQEALVKEMLARRIEGAQYLANLENQARDTKAQDYRGSFGRRTGALGERLQEGRPLGMTEEEFVEGRPAEERGIGQLVAELGPIIPGGQLGIDNLTKQLEGYGVESLKVKNIHDDMSRSLRTFSLETEGVDGVVSTATVRMDQWGNILKDTSGRFRTFGSMVGRNILKVTQWGIATGVVYGIIRKFSDLLREATEIESALVDVQITLGRSAVELGEIFSAATEIANQTASSLEGVIKGYSLAFAATGDIEQPALRAATANVLLKDSMILSKLAGIDQAIALDTLVGALRQTGMGLDRGEELLDKWVVTARNSNVSINTLASTFAIVGSTALGVGLEFEELNAITATLAETSKLSADETGNAIRGIVAGFQTSASEKALSGYGIAVRDATGQLRDFYGLLEEIALLSSSGVLTPRDITQISNAIGGGYRRGAQVEALLKNMARVQQLVIAQSYAHGEAAEALDLKLSTLKSSITQLGVAFSRFAQTMGGEGGFISVLGLGVGGLTTLIELITKLTSAMGKATPILLAYGAAMAVASTSQAKGLLARPAGELLSTIGTRAAAFGAGISPEMQGRLSTAGYLQPQDAGGMTIGGAFSSVRGGVRARTGGTSGKYGGGVDILAAAVPAIMAGTAVARGLAEEDREAAGKEFGSAAATTIGAITGQLLGGPIGMVIGSVIANGFYEGVIARETDIAGRLAELILKYTEEGVDDGPDDVDLTDIDAIFTTGQRALAGVQAGVLNAVGLFQKGTTVKFTADDVLIGQALQAGGADIGLGPLAKVSPEQAAQYDQAALEQVYARLASGQEEGPIAKALRADAEKISTDIQPMIQAYIKNVSEEYRTGSASLEEFRAAIELLGSGGLAQKVTQLQKGLEFAGISENVDDLAESLLELGEAERLFLTSAAFGVIKAVEIQNAAIASGNQDAIDSSTKLRAEAEKILTETYPLIQERAGIQDITELQVFNLENLTDEQIRLGMAASEAFQYGYAIEIAKGSEKLANAWIEGQEDTLLTRGEDLGRKYVGSVGIGARFLREGFGAQGFLEQEPKFGLRDVRDELGTEDIAAFEARYAQVKATLEEQFPDLELKEEPLGLILKDGFHEMDANMTIFNLAMQDLIDINEQQLEGVWNIPAGMTAMVAITSLYRQQDTGGGTTTDPFAPFDEAVTAEDRTIEDERGIAVIYGDPRGRGGTAPGYGPDGPPAAGESIEVLQARQARLEALIEQGPADVGMQEFQSLKVELQDTISQIYQAVSSQARTGGVGAAFGEDEFGKITEGGFRDAGMDMDMLREALTIESKIELNANIRLVVDGRTLANVVKQYLFADLQDASNAALGGGGGGYVIEGG